MTGRRDFPTRAAAMEASDDISANPSDGDTIGDVIARRYNRRDIMRGALGVTAATALLGPAALAASKAKAASDADRFTFEEIESGVDDKHCVADGYDADILLRWGDPIKPDMPDFNPRDQTAEDQEKRFGYNNDYIAYFPIDGSSKRGLLCINHEYTNEELMFPDVKLSESKKYTDVCALPKPLVDIELAAVGVTVVEVYRDADGKWKVNRHSDRNRRITALTEMTVDGPVVDEKSDRLITSYDPSGKKLFGTFANCAGGKTPWDTYLTAEENIHAGFWTEKIECDADRHPDDIPKIDDRYRIPSMWQAWGRHHDRFNVDKEPKEANRFGWIVEIDPFDKDSVPVKHTALGRFFHEGAETILSKDGRAVIYSGDDAENEYVYRFVSKGRFVKGDRENNRKLLCEGTLSVARFDSDGTGEWLPLVYGQGKLTKEASNGLFESQADVVIDARRAADQVEATKMDRPEDVQPNEETGRVYVMLTNNRNRPAGAVDAANPRPENKFGHIIEMVPEDGDFAADTFSWDILVRCGDPEKLDLGAYWNAATSEHSWFVCPDNAAVDPEGRLWIATDQGRHWKDTGRADGLYALETDGIRRGRPRMFFRVPIGAELCGPCFTPDGETLFLAVQHPGADGTKGHPNTPWPSTFKTPATRWPDFVEPDPENEVEGMPPRPSVMAITRQRGGKIG